MKHVCVIVESVEIALKAVLRCRSQKLLGKPIPNLSQDLLDSCRFDVSHFCKIVSGADCGTLYREMYQARTLHEVVCVRENASMVCVPLQQ